MDRMYTKLHLIDLKALQRLALEESEDFFKRNQHLKEAYYASLVGIALCQGAASHYIDPSFGIKDFDIWHFYKEDRNIGFPYRAHKTMENGYKGRSVDFLKRAISTELVNSCSHNPEKCIMEYLFEKNTNTKNLLLKKAIVGLFPEEIFGKVMWEGEL